ncbi:hypothetical protein ACHAXA_009000 [Cyclostephanos tholiformis]|uniref:Uncharacterized protein n=1 Tax=Cyclostephanos tholiformis TaxID=382380 RepID=A0ABD3R7G6_9STRA
MPSCSRKSVGDGVSNEGNASNRPVTHTLISHQGGMSSARASARVVLSFHDNYYKKTMWRNFRMLGKTRDKEKEARIGNEIFSLFKQKIGETGKFFKQVGGQVIEVNDARALEKIVADIYRRNKRNSTWSLSPGKVQQQMSKPQASNDNVQLFAFDEENMKNYDAHARPKRKLKVIARFDSSKFDMAAPPCKIGEGFPCPRCSAVCSYDAKECEFCHLQCYYEAGIGVVVLKERRVSVEQCNHLALVTHGADNTRVGTEEKRETKKSQSSPNVNFQDRIYSTYDNDDHIPAQPAEGLPDGWIQRRIPRARGDRSDLCWYSPKNRFKFLRKDRVHRFLMRLEETNGDESAAMLLHKKPGGKSAVCHGADKYAQVDNIAAKALVALANQKNGEVTEESRHSKRSSMQSSPPKNKAISDFAVARTPSQAGNDDSSSRGITPVLVQLYSTELQPGGKVCVVLPEERLSAHAAGVDEELLSRQEKFDVATYADLANQVKSLQGIHVETTNLLYEREASLRAAETTIASLRLHVSAAVKNRQQLVDAVIRLDNAKSGIVEPSRQSNDKSNEEIETILSKFSTERDQLAKEVEVKTAELSEMRELLSNSSLKRMELNCELENIRVLYNKAEERMNELMIENTRANEDMLAMQAKSDEANARFESSALEHQALLEKSMALTAEKQNEIEYLKRQAAKRMSQIYELTDLLTNALVEKAEVDSKLESARDQSQMRNTTNISHIESPNPFTNGTMNSQAIGTPSVNDAVATSNHFGMTIDELQCEVDRLSTELIAARDVKIELTCQIDAANTMFNTLDLKYKECLNKLDKATNEKANAVATYKDIIHKLEKRVAEQNEKMKGFEAFPTSREQSVDLIEPITAEISIRDNRKANVGDAAKEVSQSESIVDMISTPRDTVDARLDLTAEISKTMQREFPSDETRSLGDGEQHQNETIVSVASDSADDDIDTTKVQLFAFDVSFDENNWWRPKRKLKSITRFESMTFDPKKAPHCRIGEGFSCPRCSAVCSYDAKECDDCNLSCYYEAGVGVVVLKERKVTSEPNAQHYHHSQNERNQSLSKSILCHCQKCKKRDMSVRGMTSHYAKEHGGKPVWQEARYSCPFCPAPTTDSKLLSEIEAHVDLYHPGHRLQKPSTSKKTPDKIYNGCRASNNRELNGDRSETGETKCPPSWAWTKLEHVQLLPGGGKEYPRELSWVINFIEAQCKNQKENTEHTRRNWAKLFKDEAEMKRKKEDEERLLYDRGIRNRSRLMDQERLEKLRYDELENEMRIRYEYKGGFRRNPEDIEISKLCSRRIIFSINETHFDQKASVCSDSGCQLCQNDSVHRQNLFLEKEMNEFMLADPTVRSPLLQAAANVPNPSVHVVDVISFAKAKAAEEEEGGEIVAESAERFFVEKSKLEKLKNIRHALEFIKCYNAGFVTNSWAGVRAKKRLRK